MNAESILLLSTQYYFSSQIQLGTWILLYSAYELNKSLFITPC